MVHKNTNKTHSHRQNRGKHALTSSITYWTLYTRGVFVALNNKVVRTRFGLAKICRV